MGNGIDLNTPIGFAQVTMSPITGLLQTLSGLNPSQWDIHEASYLSNASRKTSATNPGGLLGAAAGAANVGVQSGGPQPVYFLVFQSKVSYSAGMSAISDLGGRRKAKFQFPYRDGQTTDDLGAKAQGFDIHTLWYGPSYTDALRAFFQQIDNPSPGVLTHPTRGKMTVVCEDWEITHHEAERQACTVRVRFTEHTFDVTQTDATKKSNAFKTAVSTALSAITTVNRVITKVQSNVFAAKQLAQQIAAVANVKAYSAAYQAMLQSLNSTFNGGSSSDLPTLLPVSSGGSGTGGGSTFQVVRAPNDAFIGIPTPAGIAPVLATQQAVDQVNALRAQADAICTQLEGLTAVITPEGINQENASSVYGGAGQNSLVTGDTAGALVFHDEIVGLRDSVVQLQAVMEAAIASSEETVQNYTVPRLMSGREVAFAVGLGMDSAYEIELLNPSLDSFNHIPAGTVLQVPVPQ